MWLLTAAAATAGIGGAIATVAAIAWAYSLFCIALNGIANATRARTATYAPGHGRHRKIAPDRTWQFDDTILPGQLAPIGGIQP